MARTATSTVDDTGTELDSIHEILDADEKRRAREAAKAPAGFDPAAVHLLKTAPINLFQPTGRTFVLVCKGCDREVKLWNHLAHWKRHKAAFDNPTKGDRVAKTMGPKEAQQRAQREARAERIAANTSEPSEGVVESVVQAVKEKETVDKPARAPKAASVAENGSREDSVRIAAKLVKAFVTEAKKLKLGKVDHATNEKNGYESIKVNGVLAGYLWFTNVAELRVEAAMSKADMPDDDRVGPYKRSRTIQARTRIGDDAAGYKLAVEMFVVAARKAQQ